MSMDCSIATCAKSVGMMMSGSVLKSMSMGDRVIGIGVLGKEGCGYKKNASRVGMRRRFCCINWGN